MNWLAIALIVICIGLALCPPKLDPAIRWKERNERKRKWSTL